MRREKEGESRGERWRVGRERVSGAREGEWGERVREWGERERKRIRVGRERER